MDLVSVIIPYYNDGRYINEAINSVLNQTYKNVEIILIDDGSDDNEAIRIFNKISNSKTKKVVCLQNKGPSYARNVGIKRCRGKYVLCLDSDDIIEKTYIEKSVKIMQANNSAGIVYCRAEYFGTKEGEVNLPPFCIDTMKKRNLMFVTSMFRKEDWIKIGGFDESFIHGLEDYDFWISILELGREVIQIPEILFYYRKKEVSRNKTIIENKDLHLKTIEIIKNKHSNFFEE